MSEKKTAVGILYAYDNSGDVISSKKDCHVVSLNSDSFKSQLQDLIEERVQQARRDSGRRIDYHSVARGEDILRYKSTSRHYRPTLSVVAGKDSAAVLGDFLTVLFDIMEESLCHLNGIQLIPTYAHQGSLDIFPLEEIANYAPSMLTKEDAKPLTYGETLEWRTTKTTVTIVVVPDASIVPPELYYAYDGGDVIWACVKEGKPCSIIDL